MGQMSSMRVIYLVSFFTAIHLSAESEPWTWTYHMLCSDDQIALFEKKRELIFTKRDIPVFNQMIFSWNALRATKGSITFMVQIREQKSGLWDAWHTMGQWGAGIQRSFLSKVGIHSEFNHVRLELLHAKVADGLRIKIVATPDFDCSLLHSFYVCVANYNYFVTERDATFSHLASIRIRNVPQYSQMLLDHPSKEKICSPTSTSMLLSYLKAEPVCPVQFAHAAFDQGLGAYGSWPFNIAHAFDTMKGSMTFKVVRLNSFSDLHKQLVQKIPVVVSVRGALQDAAKPYDNGHLILVIGWNAKKQKVICHDPAFDTIEKTYVEYNLKTFIDGWERSRRLAYVAQWS
jgi:hypothetical protein